MNWLNYFRYQFWFYRRFRFGYFEAIKYAAWKASAIMHSGREFAKWQKEYEKEGEPMK